MVQPLAGWQIHPELRFKLYLTGYRILEGGMSVVFPAKSQEKHGSHAV